MPSSPAHQLVRWSSQIRWSTHTEGALTVGLGMIENLAVIPHFGEENAEKVHRSVTLAAPGIPVVGVPERTALIRDPDGRWRQAGAGEVQVFVNGKPAGIGVLPSGN